MEGSTDPRVELVEGPVWNGGSVLRCVSDGEVDWSEVWTGSGGWVRGATVADAFQGSPVTPEDLATLGIPELAVGSPVADSPGRAGRATEAPTGAPAASTSAPSPTVVGSNSAV